MHSWSYAHFSPQVRLRSYRASLSGRLPFWASPSLSRLANASGRIEFIILFIMDWSFASGCSPPRLSATQFPSATDSQCTVRWGLPPHYWCALSGALGKASRLTPSAIRRAPAIEPHQSTFFVGPAPFLARLTSSFCGHFLFFNKPRYVSS
jgi:hypothetical protein